MSGGCPPPLFVFLLLSLANLLSWSAGWPIAHGTESSRGAPRVTPLLEEVAFVIVESLKQIHKPQTKNTLNTNQIWTILGQI